MSDLYEPLVARAFDACPAPLLEPLRGARVLVTGGTGFLGEWLLRTLTHMSAKGFDIRVQCASRDPRRFLASRGGWTDAIDWLTADAAQFTSLPVRKDTTHILHLAASSDAAQNYADPLAACRTILDGTTGCVALARATGAHLHFVSSGAVYGDRRRSDGRAREDQVQRFAPDPLDPRQAYGNAKRMAEAMVANGAERFSVSRLFAFMGAGLPLQKHFAAGNFAADAAAGRAIRIAGDGTPLRSYLHPADCAVWLLALAASAPRGRAFNVGSPEPLSIAQLADAISTQAASPAPVIAGNPAGVNDPAAYWPDVAAALALGLQPAISLAESIENTLAWARFEDRSGVQCR